MVHTHTQLPPLTHTHSLLLAKQEPPPPPPPTHTEAETARLATVLQENAVLKSEIEIMRLKCKNLLEENRRLRQASVNIVSHLMCMWVGGGVSE